jgi:hypothetical protein
MHTASAGMARPSTSTGPVHANRRAADQGAQARGDAAGITPYVSIRQHTSAYVSIRQHTASAGITLYVSRAGPIISSGLILLHVSTYLYSGLIQLHVLCVLIPLHRPHTATYVSSYLHISRGCQSTSLSAQPGRRQLPSAQPIAAAALTAPASGSADVC